MLIKEILATCVKEIIHYKPINSLIVLASYLKLTTHEKRFIQFCRRNWKGFQSEKIIIVDYFNIPEAMISYAFFLNTLAKHRDAKIVGQTWNNTYLPGKMQLIYRAFNVKETLRIKLNKRQTKKAKQQFRQIKGTIQTKKELLNLSIDDIELGIDIYESYLRDYNKPTVDLHDPKLWKLLLIAIKIKIYWEDYFRLNNIIAYIASHDVYVWYNIGCKIAYKYKIPVYLPNPRNMTRCSKPFKTYEYFQNMRERFSSFPEKNKKEAISLAKERVKLRFSGNVGIDMHYEVKSAFASNKKNVQYLKKSSKTKVLIATHCFFDNPHAFNKILFSDFYEWICFLGEKSKKTDYDWYIKLHPAPLPKTVKVINELIEKYPNFTLLPNEASHPQLVKEGINFVLTCYGSVGEEYPLLGSYCINAGYNPRVNYSFNWHPSSIEEYSQLIDKIPSLKMEINKQEIYEFYFMHRIESWFDNLLFKSYKKYLSDKKNKKQKKRDFAYEYFLNETEEHKVQLTEKLIRSFIKSKSTHLFEIFPYHTRGHENLKRALEKEEDMK